MPTPYKMYTQEEWQQILQGARAAHDQAAVQDAVNALNQYEQDAVPPTTGEIFSAEGRGVAKFPGQAAHGIGQLLHQIGQGHIGEASRTVVGGLESGMKGLVNLPGDALGLAAGDSIPKEQILGHAQDYGSSTAALTTQAAPAAIGRFAKGVSQDGLLGGLKAAVVGLPKPTGLLPGYQPTEGSVGRAVSDATTNATANARAVASASASSVPDALRGLSDADLAAKPMGQTPPLEQSAAAPGALDQAIAKLGPSLGRVKPTGFPPFEEDATLAGMSRGTPAASTGGPVFKGTPEAGGWAPPEDASLFGENPRAGFTTPETLALMVALGARLGGGAGLLKALKGINLGKVATDATMTTAAGAAMTPDSTIR